MDDFVQANTISGNYRLFPGVIWIVGGGETPKETVDSWYKQTTPATYLADSTIDSACAFAKDGTSVVILSKQLASQ
jgi:hypothetical protein